MLAVAILLGLCSTVAQAQSATSQDKLRQILERARSGRDVAAPASGAASVQRKTLDPEQSTLRNTLLRDAEAALARRDVLAAEALFDRAANILHLSLIHISEPTRPY